MFLIWDGIPTVLYEFNVSFLLISLNLICSQCLFQNVDPSKTSGVGSMGTFYQNFTSSF